MTFRVNLIPLIATLPVLFIKFWFFEGPQFLLKVTWLLVRTTAAILSLPILLKTFFSPWKGEYRQGYVGIARGIGIIVRSFMILISLFIVVTIFITGILFTLTWIGAPIAWTTLFLQTLGVVSFV